MKNMYEKVKWEIEEKSHEFLRGLYFFIRDYEGQLPNLRDIFRPQAIDWLLTESVKDVDGKVIEPKPLMDFIISTGYKDEPIIDEDGKPLICRTTPVHQAHIEWVLAEDCLPDLFEIYRFDVNYTDDNGLTHFHVACEHGLDDVVKKFLEIGQDPNLVQKTVEGQKEEDEVNPPLHSALRWSHNKVAELLLKNGADPNLVNAKGFTPLHIICNNSYGDHKIAELFFKINDELNQLVQVDAPDNLGRTPLQWAVASFLPDVVDVLLNRGADLSSFVFPSKSHFDVGVGSRYYLSDPNYKLILVPGALAVVECLEKRGYELKRSEILTLMGLFAEHGFFEKSAEFDENWYDDEKFTRAAKKVMIKPSLSLYDLIQLRPVEAIKQLKFKDYFEFACSFNFWILPQKPRKACAMHLCENLSRRFFRRLALDFFLELTRYRLPILCCEIIIKQLINQDLLHICLATTDQSS